MLMRFGRFFAGKSGALLLALGAGYGMAVSAPAALVPWDGTEASVNAFAKGTEATQTLSVAKDTTYVLTSGGENVRVAIEVTNLAAGATLTLRLRKCRLTPQGVPLTVKGGAGTVRIVSEEGTSCLWNMRSGGGDGISVASGAMVVFEGDEAAPLWVFAQGAASTPGRAVAAPQGTVRVERGVLRLLAAGASAGSATKTASLPAAIEAKNAVFVGGSTTVGFFVTNAQFDVGTLKEWPGVVAADAVTFSGGSLVSERNGTVAPSSGKLSADSNSAYLTSTDIRTRYVYPAESFGILQKVATGGQVGTEAYLRFRMQEGIGLTEAEAMLRGQIVSDSGVACPEGALTVDAGRGVAVVDATKCPEPMFAFGEGNESGTGAVALFGAVPTVTAEGVRVEYAFGISWIGMASDGQSVAVRAAVRLPEESASERVFFLTVTRELGDERKTVFEGLVPFFRKVAGDTLYETGPIPTVDVLLGGALGTFRYRVTASEAKLQ